MRRALQLVPCLLALGCGSLDNRPLQEGIVRGRLATFDAQRAIVAVLGQPALSARPNAAGDFELTNVPRGDVELFAVATDTTALRLQVKVPAADAVVLGELQPATAGAVRMSLSTSHHQRLDGARAEVVGVPLAPFVPDALGAVVLAPLPPGCYQLRAIVPGFGRFDQGVCLPDTSELELEFDLPETDGSPGLEGCLVAGCEDTYVCQTDGRCETP